MQLLLMRHGEASYTLGATDKERPLTDRGRAESARAGAWIKAQGLAPELILCSSARRTQETLAALGLDAPSVIEDALYLASADERWRGQHHARDRQRVLVMRTTQAEALTRSWAPSASAWAPPTSSSLT